MTKSVLWYLSNSTCIFYSSGYWREQALPVTYIIHSGKPPWSVRIRWTHAGKGCVRGVRSLTRYIYPYFLVCCIVACSNFFRALWLKCLLLPSFSVRCWVTNRVQCTAASTSCPLSTKTCTKVWPTSRSFAHFYLTQTFRIMYHCNVFLTFSTTKATSVTLSWPFPQTRTYWASLPRTTFDLGVSSYPWQMTTS